MHWNACTVARSFCATCTAVYRCACTARTRALPRLWITAGTIDEPNVPTFFSAGVTLTKAGEERGCRLTKDVPWQESYKAAMLERDERKLLKKIEDAHAAIQQRIEELKLASNHERSSGERQAIADALHSLRTIQRLASRSSAEASQQPGWQATRGWTDIMKHMCRTVSHAITT